MRKFPFEAEGERAVCTTDKMESQQGNTSHPGSLPAGVTPDHLQACLSQGAEVVMWNSGSMCQPAFGVFCILSSTLTAGTAALTEKHPSELQRGGAEIDGRKPLPAWTA